MGIKKRIFFSFILPALILNVNAHAQSVPTGGTITMALVSDFLTNRILGAKSVDEEYLNPKKDPKKFIHLSQLDQLVTQIMKQIVSSCFPKANINYIFDITTMVEYSRLNKKLRINYNGQSPGCNPEKNNEDCLIVKTFMNQEVIRLFITDSQVETYLAKKYPKDKAEIKNLLLFLKKVSG